LEKTESIIQEYNKYVVTSFAKPSPDLVIVEADDIYLTDIEGKKYLDFWAGITTIAVGHRHPKVQEAVKKQMDKLVHCASESYYTVPPLELAKKLCNISPIKPCKVTFHSSGTEANEVALKMAKRYTKRHEIIALQGCYHSWGYHAAIPGTPTSSYPHFAPALGPSISGIHYAPTPYCYRCGLGLEYPACKLQCAKMIEDIINFSTSRDVAAFMAETIQGVGGKVTPPDDYFQEVKKILDKYQILFILDEVQTRLGQTGKLWGAETYGIVPDVITTAKAIANGWPMSLVIAKADVADSLELGDHYTTFGANPVMCAAASVTIDCVVQDRLWEKAERLGGMTMKRLNEMKEKYEIIGDVRGKGMMIGVELVKSKKTKEPATDLAKKIREQCTKHGLIVGLGGWWNNVIRIQPPLSVKEEHINEALEIFEKVVGEESEN
jgi:4-aminobutyrate aminotransferase-like enzyme